LSAKKALKYKWGVIKLANNVSENDVLKIQQYQQQLQVFSMQKQSLQSQLMEFENSIEELNNSTKEEVYKIVGTIMIKKDKIELLSELNESKEKTDLRMSVINKQIDKISKKIKEIQGK